MGKILKYLIYAVPLLVVVAGFFTILSPNIGREKAAGLGRFLDYNKLEERAKLRPDGEKYLNFIRENEALLASGRDSDPAFYADLYITLGFNLHALGDEMGAIESYKEGLRLSPQNSYGLNNIATSYMEIGEYEKAEEAYKKLSEVLSGDSSAVINYARVHKIVRPNDEKGFLDIINEGISVTAGDNLASILVYAGSHFRDSGNKKKAEEYFAKLVELFPDNNLYKSELEDLKK